jgi:hypothetical protein
VEDQTAGFTDFETKLEDLGGFDENCNKVWADSSIWWRKLVSDVN